MIDGYLSDNAVPESFLLCEITYVDESRHSVTVQPYRFTESIVDVPLFLNPGNLSLPKKGDIAIVSFDAKGQPVCTATYPKFIKDLLPDGKEYSVSEGDVCHRAKVRDLLPMQLLMLSRTGIMRLSNWLNHGMEIDGFGGSLFLRSYSLKNTHGGVVERKGLVKRRQSTSIDGTISISNSDNQEAYIKKIGTLSSIGTLSQTSPTGLEMYEKKTTIKVPGSNDLLNLYEEVVGTGIISENPVSGGYQESIHSITNLPLRKRIIHYDVTGTVELIKEEIDCNGNIHLYISSLATIGIKIDALVPIIAQFLSLNITTSGNIDLTGTQIKLNGGADSVTLASVLSNLFNLHIHSGGTFAGGWTGTPATPITPEVIGSATVKVS